MDSWNRGKRRAEKRRGGEGVGRSRAQKRWREEREVLMVKKQDGDGSQVIT